jgi:hypothetical protein
MRGFGGGVRKIEAAGNHHLPVDQNDFESKPPGKNSDPMARWQMIHAAHTAPDTSRSAPKRLLDRKSLPSRMLVAIYRTEIAISSMEMAPIILPFGISSMVKPPGMLPASVSSMVRAPGMLP